MDPSWETQVKIHRQAAMLAINVIEMDSFSVDAQAESSRLSHIEVNVPYLAFPGMEVRMDQ